MISMDKKRELRTHWQRVAKLILAKEDVLTVSRALELAGMICMGIRRRGAGPYEN
jgi:hypothetical protein